MSKGSRPRPFSIPLKEMDARHEAIFGVKPKREQYIPPPLPDAEESIDLPKDSEQQG